MGSFYNSYSEGSYYWGIVVLVFKVTLVVLNAVLETSQIFKGIILIMIIHLYFYFLNRRAPDTFKHLYWADKTCCAAFMITLTFSLIRLSTENNDIKYACSILILVTNSVVGTYLVLNGAWLYIVKIHEFIKKIKEKRQLHQIKSETLEALEMYHVHNRSHIDKHGRRRAICIEFPER
mgnify:FL=1